jgi:hypothetical protein
LGFQIVGRISYPDLLIFEEVKIFTIEADNLKELEEKLKGIVLEIEGEVCILLPQKSISEVEKLVTKDVFTQFQKWWEMADTFEIEGEKGKLFIIRSQTFIK